MVHICTVMGGGKPPVAVLSSAVGRQESELLEGTTRPAAIVLSCDVVLQTSTCRRRPAGVVLVSIIPVSKPCPSGVVLRLGALLAYLLGVS